MFRIVAFRPARFARAVAKLKIMLFACVVGAAPISSELPALGDASSAIISPEQEQALGSAWLRELRGQAPLVDDPILYEYLYNLTYRMAAASELSDTPLNLIIINSRDINAFAAPGGILGLNLGLVLHSDSEDELASVIAHELAHLSQRHFARGLEHSRQTSMASLAALLASFALIAAGGTDAGMAALATTQAASIDAQLRFSRANEQEADRIGMQTLVRAGMNPAAMADFFEELQRDARYQGQRAPEFLLTHPVTESRITDARQRAARFESSGREEATGPDFLLVKQRVEALMVSDQRSYIKQLRQRIERATTSQSPSEQQTALRFGLASALMVDRQFEAALTEINALLKDRGTEILFLALKAEILIKSEQAAAAIALLKQGISYSPDNYTLSLLLAQAYTEAKEFTAAIPLLRAQLDHHADWPLLWYMLAEAYGRAGNRFDSLQARAEYYFLYGDYQQALDSLRSALPLAGEVFAKRARLTARIDAIERTRDDSPL